MSLHHLQRFFKRVNLLEELNRHIDERIKHHMASALQPILDAMTAGFAAINTSMTNEFAGIQAKLDELLAKIGSGGTVSAADIQAVADQFTTSATAITTAIDAETQKVAAIEPPPPPTTAQKV